MRSFIVSAVVIACAGCGGTDGVVSAVVPAHDAGFVSPPHSTPPTNQCTSGDCPPVSGNGDPSGVCDGANPPASCSGGGNPPGGKPGWDGGDNGDDSSTNNDGDTNQDANSSNDSSTMDDGGSTNDGGSLSDGSDSGVCNDTDDPSPPCERALHCCMSQCHNGDQSDCVQQCAEEHVVCVKVLRGMR